MFPLISLFVTRLLFWREKGSKLKVGRESTQTSTARDRLTNVPIMMIVEAQDPTSMGNSTSTTTTTVIMTTSITVVMTMTSTRTTRVDIKTTTVVVEVAVEANLSRRILVRLSVSSARRWGDTQMN